MSRFYIRIGGENKGPYKLDQLKQQPVTESTYVWTDGMADWLQAGEVHELRTLFHTESASDEHSPFASTTSSSTSTPDSPYTSPSPYSADSPYASPSASSTRSRSRPSSGNAGTLLGKISLALGVLSILIMSGAFIYLMVLGLQDGGQGDIAEEDAAGPAIAFCAGFPLSLIGLVIGIIGTILAEKKTLGIIGIIVNVLPLLALGCIFFAAIAFMS